MRNEPPASRCPRCGAQGVKQFEPLMLDGHNCDVPYCGKCGRNWPPEPQTPREKVLDFQKGDR